MADCVPVRCPSCRREHAYTPATFPCACGQPLTVPVLPGGVATHVRQRTWKDSWVKLRCGACGRTDDWPRPEVGCACGVVIRPAVNLGAVGITPQGTAAGAGVPQGSLPAAGLPPGGVPSAGVPRAVRRPVFVPVTIRTGQDAVTAAAAYLRWLGFSGVAQDRDRPVSGVDVRGTGVLARVDHSTSSARLRDVETLWLACLHENAVGAFFSLAGYRPDAQEGAGRLQVPLFALDLTGTPRPVNEAADRLIRTAPPAGGH